MPPSTETVNLGDSSLYGSTDRRPQHVVDVPGAAGQYDEAIDAERDAGALRKPAARGEEILVVALYYKLNLFPILSL